MFANRAFGGFAGGCRRHGVLQRHLGIASGRPGTLPGGRRDTRHEARSRPGRLPSSTPVEDIDSAVDELTAGRDVRALTAGPGARSTTVRARYRLVPDPAGHPGRLEKQSTSRHAWTPPRGL
jgi:hypothetical protein